MANDRIFLSTSSGLYFSDDLGESWEKVKESFSSIYFEPNLTKNKNGDIYVYDSRGGINYTTDNGLSWQTQYFTHSLSDAYITSIGIYDEKIFIGTNKGLMYLVGDQFTTISISVFDNMEISAISVLENKIIVGTKNNGLYISEDQGVTWSLKTNDFPINLEINALEISGNKLYMGTSWNGIYYTEDWGATWSQKNSGLQTNNIIDLYIDGESIYAITDSYNNIYSSTTRGNSWTLIDNGVDYFYAPNAIISKGNLLIVGAWHGILKSNNAGNSWSLVNKGLRDGWFKSLQVSENGTIFANSSYTGVYIKTVADDEFTTFESLRGGNLGYSDIVENIIPIVLTNTVKFYDIATKEVVNEISTAEIGLSDILIATDVGYFMSTLTSGVYHLTEAKIWETFNINLTSLVVNDFKAAGGVLYAATEGGLFKSNISGSDWEKFEINISDPGINRILIHDNIIIAATNSNSTYLSTNMGTTWELIEDLENNHISDIIYHNQRFYACSYGRLHFSSDLGKTWAATSVPDLFLESLLIVENKLYIGTIENSILSTELLQKDQNIDFQDFPLFTLNDTEFLLDATSSSGLPITYSNSNNDVVRLEGNKVIILAPGTTTITAHQSGDLFNQPAVSVARVLTITEKVTGISKELSKEFNISPNPGNGNFKISNPSTISLNPKLVTVSDVYGKPVNFNISLDENHLHLDLINNTAGIYILKVEINNQQIVKRIIKND